MGLFYGIKCKECGNEEHYKLGRGYFPFDEAAYEEIMKEQEFKNLRASVKSLDDIYETEYRIYYCKECKTFENHYSFKVRDCKSFRLLRKCKKCGKVMKSLKDTQNFWRQKFELKCRNCGTESILDMNEFIQGLWD